MPFWRMYFHVVWSMQERRPQITPQIEPRLYDALRSNAERLGVVVHALNGTSDHVHLVLTMPPTAAPASVIGQLKGASAHLVNREVSPEQAFSWEEGYGIFTVGPRQLATAVAYVKSQKQHHSRNTTNASLEVRPESGGFPGQAATG